MTPPHVTKLTDTGENDAAPEKYVTRDAMEIAVMKHKEECDLHEKVDKLRLWVARASVLGLIATVASPVILAWWLSTRLPAPQHSRAAESPPSLINQAHAEPK